MLGSFHSLSRPQRSWLRSIMDAEIGSGWASDAHRLFPSEWVATELRCTEALTRKWCTGPMPDVLHPIHQGS